MECSRTRGLRGGEQDSGHQHPGQGTDLRGLQGKLRPRKVSAAPGAFTADRTAGNRHLSRSTGSPRGKMGEGDLGDFDLGCFLNLINQSSRFLGLPG